MCQVSYVMCHILHVICHMWHVICHLLLTPTATATDPSPAKSLTMHSRLVCKDPKKPKTKFKAKNNWNAKNPKMSRGILISAIHWKAGFPKVDKKTLWRTSQPILNWPMRRFRENTEIMPMKRCLLSYTSKNVTNVKTKKNYKGKTNIKILKSRNVKSVKTVKKMLPVNNVNKQIQINVNNVNSIETVKPKKINKKIKYLKKKI